MPCVGWIEFAVVLCKQLAPRTFHWFSFPTPPPPSKEESFGNAIKEFGVYDKPLLLDCCSIVHLHE